MEQYRDTLRRCPPAEEARLKDLIWQADCVVASLIALRNMIDSSLTGTKPPQP